MTQLGEPVAIGMVDTFDVECPFDHDNPTPPTVKNDLIGVGTTLASRMKSASSTQLYEPYRKSTKLESIKNPREDSTHPFYKKAKCVTLRVKRKAAPDSNGDESTAKKQKLEDAIHTYPVTCAAHHCIPAQEALKHSPLLAYMVKKGEAEKLKDETYSDGVVWANVGYDVNGSENGVYLPGNYAVGGGRGGMKVWTGPDDNNDEDADDDEAITNGSDSPTTADVISLDTGPAIDDGQPDSNLLTGSLYNVSMSNRKWRYVAQAMKACPGQFHDRHEDYSKEVIGTILEKIYDRYVIATKKYISEKSCDKCKELMENNKKLGIPTPFALVKRLNGVSTRFNALLSGSIWPDNVYTSKWVEGYLQALKRAKVNAQSVENMSF